MDNSISIRFSPNTTLRLARSVYQYDYGVRLKLIDADPSLNMHIDYTAAGSTDAQPGVFTSEDGCLSATLPNDILAQDSDIEVYIRASDQSGGQTVMHITIPLIPRAKPNGYNISDNEMARFDDIISSLSTVAQSASSADTQAREAARLAQEAAVAMNDVVVNSVRFNEPQDLSAEQREQARDNIGIGSSPERSVLTDSDAQKFNFVYEKILVHDEAVSRINDAISADGTLEITEYSHPKFPPELPASYSKALYKIAVTDEGHAVTPEPATKEDITSLGIPGSDTTYSLATSGSDGLMSSADKAKLDGITDATQQKSGLLIPSDKIKLDSFSGLVSATSMGLAPRITNVDGVLRGDGTWGDVKSHNNVKHAPVPASTDINKVLTVVNSNSGIAWANLPVMTGATSAIDGTSGLVPAPTSANVANFLKGDGTWATPYVHPTGDGNKHVPATGTSNEGKFLVAGSTAGAMSWQIPKFNETKSKLWDGTATLNDTEYVIEADKSKTILDYTFLAAYCSDHYMYIILTIIYKDSTYYVRGAGSGSIRDDGSPYTIYIWGTTNSNKFKLKGKTIAHVPNSGHGASTGVKIKQIYGLY